MLPKFYRDTKILLFGKRIFFYRYLCPGIHRRITIFPGFLLDSKALLKQCGLSRKNIQNIVDLDFQGNPKIRDGFHGTETSHPQQ